MKLFDNIGKDEKMLLVNNMAVALKAGLTPTEAIQINIEQTTSPKFKKVLTDIKNSVEGGKSLSESFGMYNNIFSNVFINIIFAGEKSGKLEQNLKHLGEQLQREDDLQKKVQSSLLYPGIILVATVLISIALSVFVLPRILTLFRSFGEDLPFLTQVILGVADGIRIYWPGIIIGVIVVYLVYRYSGNVPAIKNFLDRLILHLPIMGSMWRFMHLSRITRTFGSLLSSGLSINECMTIVESSQTNDVYRLIAASMSESINKGSTLYDALNKSKYIPALASKMVGMGEKTGNLENTFSYLAEYYEKELYRIADNLATTIEPILLVLVGVGVGVVAIAIISPIYQLTGSLNRFR